MAARDEETAGDRPDDEFVIEELARRTGMTVRSLRSYQSRKLLPPPTVRGRTGYYDEGHVARLQLIQNLQSEGIKLNSIARMLDEGGRSDADLLEFTRSVQTMFTEPGGSITTVEDLAGRFGVELESGASLLERAERLGLVRQIGDDAFEELSPRLIDVGEHAVQVLGLGAHEALDVVAKLRKHADGVATIYLDLFIANIWTPFVEADQPQEQWSDVRRALDEVRSLATEALTGAFELVMSERASEVFERELTRPRSRRRRDANPQP
jgi:DNA-binding transcriptional MerR regulator